MKYMVYLPCGRITACVTRANACNCREDMPLMSDLNYLDYNPGKALLLLQGAFLFMVQLYVKGIVMLVAVLPIAPPPLR